MPVEPVPGQRSSGARIAVALILQAGFHLLGLVMLVALVVATVAPVAAVSWVPQRIPVLVMGPGLWD